MRISILYVYIFKNVSTLMVNSVREDLVVLRRTYKSYLLGYIKHFDWVLLSFVSLFLLWSCRTFEGTLDGTFGTLDSPAGPLQALWVVLQDVCRHFGWSCRMF